MLKRTSHPASCLYHSLVSHIAPPVAKVVPEWHGWHSLTVIRRYPFKKKRESLEDATADKLHNVCASKHDSGGRGGLKWWRRVGGCGGWEKERGAKQSARKGFSRETLVDYISSPWAWPFQFQLEFFYLHCSDGYQLSRGNAPPACVCVNLQDVDTRLTTFQHQNALAAIPGVGWTQLNR